MGAKDEKELRALLLKRSLKPVSSLGTQARGGQWGVACGRGRGQVVGEELGCLVICVAGRDPDNAAAPTLLLSSTRSPRHLPPVPRQLVLDIGCSTGAFVVAGGLGSSNLPGAIALQIVFYFGGARRWPPPRCIAPRRRAPRRLSAPRPPGTVCVCAHQPIAPVHANTTPTPTHSPTQQPAGTRSRRLPRRARSARSSSRRAVTQPTATRSWRRCSRRARMHTQTRTHTYTHAQAHAQGWQQLPSRLRAAPCMCRPLFGPKR